MATIKLSVTEFQQLLEITPVEQSILIVGSHGLGKSQIVENHYANKGFKVVPLFLGQMSDAGDLLGLPAKKETTVAGVTTEIMDFLPPHWWESETPFCLFLDEINRARPEILQVVFDLVLNRKLGGRKLPEGSVIVAAANYSDNVEYQVVDLDPALKSRFNIYELLPTTEEWTNWAAKNGINSKVISFIQSNPSYLDSQADEHAGAMDKDTDRRAWVKVSGYLDKFNTPKMNGFQTKIIGGIVGTAAAGLLKRHIDSMVTIDGEKLLTVKKFGDLEVDLMTLTLTDIIFLNKQIQSYLVANYNKIAKSAVLEALIVKNFKSYIQYLETQGQREAIGDLTQIVSQNTDVAGILLAHEDILNLVTDYIDSI